MKNKLSSLVAKTLILAMAYLVIGCEDTHQDRYDDPPWLGGSIIETLEEEGNFNIYFELMDKAGYRESIEKGLFTVFVATDSAYEVFFEENGIASVDDVTDEMARNYITLNLLNTPRARHQIVYDHVFGVWQEEGSELGALTFRIETRSKSTEYEEVARYDPNYLGQTLKIEEQDKFVPLISSEFFRDYAGASDGSDYTFFFPDTEWGGLQWYNANIIRKEVRASNGFIYFLDRAVPYIPSIEEFFMANEDKYSVFYDAMQRFATYNVRGYDDDFNRLYRKEYDGVRNIAPEYGPTDDGVYSRRDIFSLFIPTDDIFQKYLDEKILAYYPNLDSVPDVTLIYLLQSHMLPSFLLPSKMDKPTFDAFGDIVEIDADIDIKDATMLSNAAFFSMNKVMEPNAFKTVGGPLFFNSNYSVFLRALFSSGLIPSISKFDISATVFAPTNEELALYGIQWDALNMELQKREVDSVYYRMDGDEITEFVQDHIIYQDDTDYSGEGFVELKSGNFIHYNNSVITAGGNSEAGDNSKIVQALNSGINGTLYYLDNIIKAPENDIAVYIDSDPDLSEFKALLDSAGLIKGVVDPLTLDTIPELGFLVPSEELTGFVPNNNAVLTAMAAGDIPTEKAELYDFLIYHFLTEKAVFDDGVFSGNAITARVEGVDIEGANIYSELIINNSAGNLQIEDMSGQVVSVNHSDANTLINLGVAHKINKVLKFK